ncbi:alanine racemase [Thorsellia anophelis]|uniref:Alanine racemase n=1 Tax=Thorsellia anophelis DSM 18579 TaxID=1123402 RepID=A0A1H9Y4M0_9GAMM|nr:alanine racemase [Thorsellia anophelis]SES63735.1 alanine racemase [Thorsellia anophelis DSM 18579]
MKAATAIINRSALIHNYNTLKKLSPNSQLMAVVKANGYGHGALEIAKTLHFADYCGVARVDEALALRESGITSPILLLEGFVSEYCLPLLIEHQLETVIHCQEQLDMLLAFKSEQLIKVWLKLDTGMHRLGIRMEEAENAFMQLSCSAIVEKPINLMTHFACSDELDNPLTQNQINQFDTFSQTKAIGLSSLAASGGILFWPESRRDLNRAGIILYGVSPLTNKPAIDFDLKPVMQLESSLIAVRRHLKGESVGYNATWTGDRDTTIGVVAIGYGDGYSRSLKNGTPVLVNGREVPLIGRVSMDMITVDLGPNATDKVGDTVILWGKALPIERIALQNGLSPYELMTQLTSRLKLEYIDE